MERPTRITITIPTDSYFMSGIRDFTLNIVKNTTNFEEKWAFRFQSLIDELCNNAIEYGSSPGSEIRIIFYYVKEEYLQITVEDTGTGKKPCTAEELKKLIAEKKQPGYVFSGIRGRGLVKIVSEWSDELLIEDRQGGGLKVSVKKFLKDARKKPENLENTEQEEKNIPKIQLTIN